MRYKLDELGWFQFESLVTALLKADIGIGVESWASASGDHGKDAFFKGTLPFPTKSPRKGRFTFQVKYSAARDQAAALADATAKEMGRIAKRRAAGKWSDPTHYCLITNVALRPTDRRRLKALVRQALPKTSVHALGGADVCAALDRHPSVRRSFPQLLGLADLTELIDGVVTKEHRERSQSAIDIARQYVGTFVPTAAYERTWAILKDHHFVVLCGPPEMGKTTIAWIVALSQVASGWQGVLCRRPSDFFANYSADRQQVFVADDAFGRTEYQPALVSAWEAELPLMLPRLDQRHWLLWTSRKHLLERAVQKMDLQVTARKFPDPGKIIVEARTLSSKERALILYRHAKRHLNQERDRAVVRQNCRPITAHHAFTPERIRSFVDWLPTSGVTELDPQTVSKKVWEIIDNPTERMRKAYIALSPAHKWVLVSLLEEAGYAKRAQLEQRYLQHCPRAEREPFGLVVDQLVDAFLVQVGSQQNDSLQYSWVHPSYRDLVIEELSLEPSIKKTFLESADAAGIQLAISSLGGAKGGRRVPLLADADDWTRLRARAIVVATTTTSMAADLLDQVAESIETESEPLIRAEFVRMLAVLCDAIRAHWDSSGELLGARELTAYAKASRQLDAMPPLPSVASSWTRHLNRCVDELELAQSAEWFDADALVDFVDFVEAVRQSEPRWLQKIGFPELFVGLFERIESAMERELEAEPDLDDNDALEGRASQLLELSGALGTLTEIGVGDFRARFKDVGSRMREHAQYLKEEVQHDEEPGEDGEYAESAAASFDVERLFSDL